MYVCVCVGVCVCEHECLNTATITKDAQVCLPVKVQKAFLLLGKMIIEHYELKQ